MHGEGIGGHKLAHIMGLTFNMDTIYMTWLTGGIVLLIAVGATRRMQIVPHSRLQNFVEMIAEALYSQIKNSTGPKGRQIVPLIITLFIYLIIANWLGLIPGLTSPTNDINTTMALALFVLLTSHLLAVVNKGLFSYLHHFIEPYVLFLPINLIEEISKPITLAARLFGNIFAGEILLIILGMLVPFVIPTIWLGFSVFVGIVQALIFTIMSITYFANALQDHHDD